MKIIDVNWFNTHKGFIGIVLTENEFRQRAYICQVDGYDEAEDVALIIDYGAKLTLNQAIGFFGDLVKSENYK